MGVFRTFFVFGLVCVPAFAGFLEPASFPTVVADMPFVDRIALFSAGYDQFESEYDADGNCVSGCSYASPKLEDELAALERWNALVKTELVDEYDYTENDDGSLTPPNNVNRPPEYNPPSQFPEQKPNDYTNANCEARNTSFGTRTIPWGSPLGFISCISSPWGVSRTIFGESKVHYGIDLRASTGMPIYAPASGTVAMVMNNNQTCGNGVVIQHANGYSTKYCHLSIVSVKHGQQLSAGCMIGRVGNTGRSTGPHLHYAVYKDGMSNKHSINPEQGFIEPHPRCR